MGWVVKESRADRALAEAAARLEALERLGADLQAEVRRKREARAPKPAPAGRGSAGGEIAAAPSRRRPSGKARASMRDRALQHLFHAGDTR